MTDATSLTTRVNTWGSVGRGWRVFVPVVVGNAIAQALTTAPFLTPAVDVGFLLVALASVVALVASAALIVAGAHAAANGTRWRLSGRLVLAASVAVIVVGLVAVVSLPATPVAILLAFAMLPGVARGESFAAFRAFATAPAHAIVLTLVTLLTIVVLCVGALLLGFFLTGWASAALTWLAFGAFAVVLTCAWTVLVRRGSRRERG